MKDNAWAFLSLLRQSKIPTPATEFRFHPVRRWRFDFAWPDQKVALECDGGVWTRGRHTRGAGWVKDAEKLNCAATLGWRMLRCTPQGLCTEYMIGTIKAALSQREDK